MSLWRGIANSTCSHTATLIVSTPLEWIRLGISPPTNCSLQLHERKMSVILGILQSSIVLKGLNAVSSKKSWIFILKSSNDYFCIWFFGYMIIIIFVKWSVNWEERVRRHLQSRQ